MKKLNGDSSHHVQQSPCAVGAGLLHIIDFSAVADAQSGRVGDGRFFYFSALEFALSTPRGQATGQRPASAVGIFCVRYKLCYTLNKSQAICDT